MEKSGGRVEKLRLQKLLFLFSQQKEKPEYEFIPYKFGCFSYSLQADMNSLVNKDLVNESEHHYSKKTDSNYFNQLKLYDQKMLNAILSQYEKVHTSALIKKTYLEYPYYAIHSEISNQFLTEKQLSQEFKSIQKNETVLFTIGYEGRSIEAYLNLLIKNDVKVLVDVRKNPLSMKFGFSKSRLSNYCYAMNIDYVHLPDLGIQSNKRKQLNTQADYDNLFKNYKDTTLENTDDAQASILSLLKQKRRIALTCFEKNIHQCHRKHLGEKLQSNPGFIYDVIHI